MAEVVRKVLSEEVTFELREEVIHVKIWGGHFHLEGTRSAKALTQNGSEMFEGQT